MKRARVLGYNQAFGRSPSFPPASPGEFLSRNEFNFFMAEARRSGHIFFLP